jgi:hypothetical protein
MNDPREMTMRSVSGGILEQDNRQETMYQWGAMILDLCDMPVSEYMKPMTVIGLGGGSNVESGESTTTIVDIIAAIINKIPNNIIILFFLILSPL